MYSCACALWMAEVQSCIRAARGSGDWGKTRCHLLCLRSPLRPRASSVFGKPRDLQGAPGTVSNQPGFPVAMLG